MKSSPLLRGWLPVLALALAFVGQAARGNAGPLAFAVSGEVGDASTHADSFRLYTLSVTPGTTVNCLFVGAPAHITLSLVHAASGQPITNTAGDPVTATYDAAWEGGFLGGGFLMGRLTLVSPVEAKDAVLILHNPDPDTGPCWYRLTATAPLLAAPLPQLAVATATLTPDTDTGGWKVIYRVTNTGTVDLSVGLAFWWDTSPSLSAPTPLFTVGQSLGPLPAGAISDPFEVTIPPGVTAVQVSLYGAYLGVPLLPVKQVYFLP